MTTSKLSIVTVYTDLKVLSKYLLASLRKQSLKDYLLILIDNTSGRYRNAAQLLNQIRDKLPGKYVMFIHPDVRLEGSDWLSKCLRILDSLPRLGVAGVAGRREDIPEVIGNVMHGNPPRPACGRNISKPVRVQTVDPLLFIVPNHVLRRVEFDEGVCVDWHLYAEDYCLEVSYRLGLYTYVIPLKVYHLSTGVKPKKRNVLKPITYLPYPEEFYASLKRMMVKYRGRVRKICLTCGTYRPTKYPGIALRLLAWRALLKRCFSAVGGHDSARGGRARS